MNELLFRGLLQHISCVRFGAAQCSVQLVEQDAWYKRPSKVSMSCGDGMLFLRKLAHFFVHLVDSLDIVRNNMPLLCYGETRSVCANCISTYGSPSSSC